MHLFNSTLLQGGKYKIVRFIKSGGFGCTYEVEHVMLRKKVAIKEFFVKDFCNRDEKMQIKIFNIPIGAEETQVEELNHFLRANKIIDVKRELATIDCRGCWSFFAIFGKS